MDDSIRGTDNKIYHLSPLTLGDTTAFTRFAQYRDWQNFQKLRDDLPPDVFATESQRLLIEASKRHWNETTPEVRDVAMSVEGSIYFLYLSLRRNHPDLSLDQVADLLTIETVKDASDRLAALSGLNGSTPTTKKKTR